MTDKLTGKEIIKLLGNMIGHTDAYGDSAIDEKILGNLKTLIDVTNWCLDGVKRASQTMHNPEYSMRLIGTTAMEALYDWADWIEEAKEENNRDKP